jgi:nucleoside-diphosphate-sugar epimerase
MLFRIVRYSSISTKDQAPVNILVTGNMGYVGPGVVQQLRASYPGSRLIGLDMGYFANVLSATQILPECRVDVQYFGDVRRPPAGIMRGVDVVVHLAAISNDPMGNRFERVTLEINHRASLALAVTAKAAGAARFVFASSCSVYGFAGDDARTEESAVDPLTAYARSKVLVERDLASLADEGFQVTCLRFATACGLSERLRLDLVLNDFVASAMAAKTIRILSDGTPWRPLIHVRDMARAIDWAVARDGDPYLNVNAGDDEANYQVRELAAAVAKVIPGVEIWVNPQAVPDKRSYRVSFARFRQLAPHHQPRYRLLDTIEELAEGLARMGFSDGNFRESGFIRLNVLADLHRRGLIDEDLVWTAAAREAGLKG